MEETWKKYTQCEIEFDDLIKAIRAEKLPQAKMDKFEYILRRHYEAVNEVEGETTSQIAEALGLPEIED